jgi:hypothetical protein
MEDNEIDATIKSLHEKVNQITSTSTSESTIVSLDAKNTSFFPSSILKSRIYYGVIPLTIFLLFLFWKPWFIMEDISIDGKLPEKKFSYKKLFIATFIVTFIIAMCIFAYSYKNKKNIETI